MRRLGAIGAALFFTGVGWIFSHHFQATQTPHRDVETKGAQVAMQEVPTASSQVPKLSTEERQTCTAYDASDPASDDDNRGEAYEVIKKFEGGTPVKNYVIAIVPDPRHSRLSLLFDRSLEAIEDAAQDEGFSFDSFWLPWRVDKETFGSRDDQIAAKRSLHLREDCPGILLFRKSIGPEDSSSASHFEKGLAVLIIAEQPTGGLNVNQWKYAINWLDHRCWREKANAVRILGPTFSGTLPSLYRRLADLPHASGNTSKPNLYIFSGTVGACKSVTWFQEKVKTYDPGARFGVFQENDELQIYRFLNYLKNDQRESLDTVAILSEDETAYGGSIGVDKGNPDVKGNCLIAILLTFC